MAHLINYLDGKYQFVFAGEKAWHGLGDEVSEHITMAEMAAKAGSDFDTETVSLFANLSKWKGPAGNKTPTNMKAIVNNVSGDILDVVPQDSWHDAQNSECIKLADMLIAGGNGLAKVSASGVLETGATFYTLKLDASFDLFNGRDEHHAFVNIINLHKYGKSTFGNVSKIRTVCNNTVQANLSEKVQHFFKVGHRHPFKAENALVALGAAIEKVKEYKEASEFLASKSYTVEDMKNYFSKLYPITGKNVREKEYSRPAMILTDIVDQQPGAEFAKGTWYNLFNAVTFFENHMRGNKEDRSSEVMFGQSNAKMVNALDVALAMAA